MTEEQIQQDEPLEGQSEEQETPVEDMIHQLLNPDEEAEPEEAEQEEVEEEAEPEETVEEKKTEAIVDDSLIAKYRTLVSLSGKPIEELAKSYDNITREFGRRAQELSNLKKERAELVRTIEELKSNIVPAKEEAPPDPIDDPKGYEEYLTRKILKQLKGDKPVNPIKEETAPIVQDNGASQVQNYIVGNIQAKLPQGVTIENALQKWSEAKKDVYFNTIRGQAVLDEEVEKYFFENPDVLIQQVLEVNKQVAKEEKKSISTETYKTTKQAIKKASAATKPPISTAPKTHANLTLTPEEKLLKEILDKNTPND